MPLTYQQIENNSHFATILDICNPIHTAFTQIRERLKRTSLKQKKTLSNDALFLEEINLGLIAILDRLIVCHEEYESNDNLEVLSSRMMAISGALNFSRINILTIIHSTGNEIQDSLKQIQLPALAEAILGLKELIDHNYIFTSSNLFTPLAWLSSAPTVPAESSLIEIELEDRCSTKLYF